MSSQLELSLPFEEITELANRIYLRNNFKRAPRDSYFIPFNQILIREGFNQRIDYDDIPELADSLFLDGQKEPLVLDVLPDGRCFIDEGHRRYKAFQLNIERKSMEPDVLVEFYPNKKETTELQRMLNQHISNNHKKNLKPLELAGVVHSVKHNYGTEYSHEQLAEMFGVSRQKIDNLILFAEASDDVKLAIHNMKFTNAVDYIRDEKKRQKQVDKAEKDAGQSTMYVASNGKDINADEEKALNDLEKDIALNEGEATQQFVNTDTGEMVTEIPEEQNPISPSVITEPVAIREKDKYDSGRPEVFSIQNIIKLLDKAEVVAERIPDAQASKDLCDYIKWMRKDAMEVREWVHSNKKQNKAR